MWPSTPIRQPAGIPPIVTVNAKGSKSDPPSDKWLRSNEPLNNYLAGPNECRIPPTMLQTLAPPYQPSMRKLYAELHPCPQLAQMKSVVDGLLDNGEEPRQYHFTPFFRLASQAEWMMLTEYVYAYLAPIEMRLFRLLEQVLPIATQSGHKVVLENVDEGFRQCFHRLPKMRGEFAASLLTFDPDELETFYDPEVFVAEIAAAVLLIRRKSTFVENCRKYLEKYGPQGTARGAKRPWSESNEEAETIANSAKRSCSGSNQGG